MTCYAKAFHGIPWCDAMALAEIRHDPSSFIDERDRPTLIHDRPPTSISPGASCAAVSSVDSFPDLQDLRRPIDRDCSQA